MCNIWRGSGVDRLKPEHMGKLPVGLRTINLSGGEPFLRDDLPEFVRHCRRRCPNATITISTNAFLTGRIVKMMKSIRRIDPQIRLAVSLDGIGPVHDRIRGTDGAFDLVVELVDRLRRDGFGGLRLSMTLTNDNLDQFLPVAKLAARHGLELGVVAAHASRTHLAVDHLPDLSMPPRLRQPFGEVISQWLRSARPKNWLRAHFAFNTYRILTGRRQSGRCHAGGDFFFLQADGTVYSCSVAGEVMGDITRQPWDEIWSGLPAQRARRSAGRCTENCWMICTARSTYRATAARIALWVAIHKPLAHLRALRLPKPAGCGHSEGNTSADSSR